MSWMLLLMSFKHNAGSKCYHIKHSKIRSGEVCERPYCQRDGTKIFIEINTADATEEDIKNLYDLLSRLLTKQRKLLTNGSLYGWRDFRACDDEDGKHDEAKKAGGEGK